MIYATALEVSKKKINPNQPLKGGIGTVPLTDQQIKWAKQREEHAEAQRSIQRLIQSVAIERSFAKDQLK